jgi:hypothetical protein
MTQLNVLDTARERGGYKVDASRGERVGRVSSEWFSRPADERYLSLSELFGAVRYLRQLPAPLAAINLQYGLTSHRAELIKTLEIEDGRVELSAVTGPDYGRIFDHELVAAVQRIAGNGTGDTRWKIPGVLDWSTS